MKYTNRVEINVPKEKVVELWNDENNFSQWQEGFVKTELIKGIAGAKGSERYIYLTFKNKPMRLRETFISNKLPDEKTTLIEHEHTTNTMTTRFREISDGVTEYLCDIEYTELKGIMVKVMAFLFPSVFKKQSQKWLDNFKSFAEAS